MLTSNHTAIMKIDHIIRNRLEQNRLDRKVIHVEKSKERKPAKSYGAISRFLLQHLAVCYYVFHSFLFLGILWYAGLHFVLQLIRENVMGGICRMCSWDRVDGDIRRGIWDSKDVTKYNQSKMKRNRASMRKCRCTCVGVGSGVDLVKHPLICHVSLNSACHTTFQRLTTEAPWRVYCDTLVSRSHPISYGRLANELCTKLCYQSWSLSYWRAFWPLIILYSLHMWMDRRTAHTGGTDRYEWFLDLPLWT